jgi:hypothetical protein
VAFDDHGFEREVNDAAGLRWRLFIFVFGHSAWFTPSSWQVKCSVPHTKHPVPQYDQLYAAQQALLWATDPSIPEDYTPPGTEDEAAN